MVREGLVERLLVVLRRVVAAGAVVVGMDQPVTVTSLVVVVCSTAATCSAFLAAPVAAAGHPAQGNRVPALLAAVMGEPVV
jgi:hypothetical protein